MGLPVQHKLGTFRVSAVLRWPVLLIALSLPFLSCASDGPDGKDELAGPQDQAVAYERVRGIIHAHSIYSHDACDYEHNRHHPEQNRD